MSQNTIGLLIGGILPALMFGLSGVFAKCSTNAQIGTAQYLMCIAASIVAVAAGFHWYLPSTEFNSKAAFWAVMSGFVWAIGSGSVAIALTKFEVPLSQLVPLYNTNSLVAVLLALWIFSEWQSINALQLIFGACLIIAGAILVTNA